MTCVAHIRARETKFSPRNSTHSRNSTQSTSFIADAKVCMQIECARNYVQLRTLAETVCVKCCRFGLKKKGAAAVKKTTKLTQSSAAFGAADAADAHGICRYKHKHTKEYKL